MANPGKNFEDDVIRSVAENKQLSLYRLYDTTGGRAGVKNISDFIAYKYPHEYYLELKSTKENRLNFKAITDKQYNGLLEKSKIKGIYAGIIINYREIEKTYFVEINTIRNMREMGGKSISSEYASKVGVEMRGIKRVTRFRYDLEELLTNIPKEVGRPWEQEQKKESYAQ